MIYLASVTTRVWSILRRKEKGEGGHSHTADLSEWKSLGERGGAGTERQRQTYRPITSPQRQSVVDLSTDLEGGRERTKRRRPSKTFGASLYRAIDFPPRTCVYTSTRVCGTFRCRLTEREQEQQIYGRILLLRSVGGRVSSTKQGRREGGSLSRFYAVSSRGHSVSGGRERGERREGEREQHV